MDFTPHVTRKVFGTDGTLGLFVALYLILLAFFIVLTAGSTQTSERVLKTITSVNSTFKNETRIASGQSQKQLAEAASNDPTLLDIQTRLTSEFNISGEFAYSGGYIYQVRLPLDYLFERGSFRVRQQVHATVTNVLDALADNGTGERRELVLLFGGGDRPPERELTRSQEVAVRRAGAMAHLVGLHDGLAFSSGFGAFSKDEVVLIFRKSPRLTGEVTGAIQSQSTLEFAENILNEGGAS